MIEVRIVVFWTSVKTSESQSYPIAKAAENSATSRKCWVFQGSVALPNG